MIIKIRLNHQALALWLVMAVGKNALKVKYVLVYVRSWMLLYMTGKHTQATLTAMLSKHVHGNVMAVQAPEKP